MDKFPITHTDGVITIEIINAQPGDSGKYKCVASNTLGSDSSDCVVIVEGSQYTDGPAKSSGNNSLLLEKRKHNFIERPIITDAKYVNGVNGH